MRIDEIEKQAEEKATEEKALTVTKKDLPAKPVKLVSVEDWLKSEQMKAQVGLILPKHLNPERLLRIALNLYKTNPNIFKATKESVLAAVIQSSIVGLEPTPILGHCYFVPYKQNVQFIIGYKGYLELIRRSRDVGFIKATVVYDNDLFEYERGNDEKLKYIPASLRKDGKFAEKGKIKGVFLEVKYKDGSSFNDWMDKEDVYKSRDLSKSYQFAKDKKETIWYKFEPEMFQKTIIRKNAKFLPLSIEIQQAMATDETIARLPENAQETEDMSFISYPEDEVQDADFTIKEEE